MEKLIQLYKNWSGAEPKSVEKIPGAGSNREYYRFYDAEGKSCLLYTSDAADDLLTV